jgi:hypothetical protein
VSAVMSLASASNSSYERRFSQLPRLRTQSGEPLRRQAGQQEGDKDQDRNRSKPNERGAP